MPELDSRLLLDLLLGFIVLLFVPFGIRRGVAKEAMVSAGILLGALLGGAWAEEAGGWLADALGLEPLTGSFAVALAALLAGTFLIGYGAGGAVGNLRPGVPSRLAGGLLAAVNGVLFLSYLLLTIERWLQPGDALDDGIVTGTLMRRFDEVLLAGAGIVLLLIVAGWIVNAVRGPRPAVEAAVPPRSRPVRVASGADAGKFEPVAVSPPTGRAAPPLAETTPLPAEPAAGNPWQRPLGAPPANGRGGSSAGGSSTPADGDWLHRPGEAAAAGTTGRTAWIPPTSDGGRWFGAPGGAGGTTDDRRRCPTCGAQADPSDLYCQQCGKTL
ncbi:MAG TPA: CvpA family protein [Thermomicrobiales bacterium]|nr:CvpA family protein [Thermomicrobiales bacterium]